MGTRHPLLRCTVLSIALLAGVVLAAGAPAMANTPQLAPPDPTSGPHLPLRPPRLTPPPGDALLVPEAVARRARTANLRPRRRRGTPQASPAPGFYETSEFMIGRVAVGLILPESDGSLDPNLENWTAEEQALVIGEVQAAMDWWAAQEPRAHLEFVYDVHLGVPSGYEPITRSAGGGSTDEGLWIKDAMIALGYPDPAPSDPLSYFEMVRAYDNDLRAHLDADWAFTIFVVDSSADPDGAFSNERYAGGYLGGPFEFMTYDNGSYGISNMDFIAAHETGHVFRALDEYPGSHLGSDHSGYLNVINGNHIQGGQTDVPCVMKSIYALPSHPICGYTKEQLGWRDSDDDDVLDPLDTEPDTAFITHWLHPIRPGLVHLEGRAIDVPYPQGGQNVITPHPTTNPEGKLTIDIRPMSLNPVVGVERRWDGGEWSARGVTAGDGAFDGPEEWFAVDVEMAPGAHRVEARARNRVKHSQPAIEHTEDSPALIQIRVPYRYFMPIMAQNASTQAYTTP